MRSRLIAGALVLVAVVAALCDRAIHCAPELLAVWVLAIIGIAISGATLLLSFTRREERIAKATIAKPRT